MQRPPPLELKSSLKKRLAATNDPHDAVNQERKPGGIMSSSGHITHEALSKKQEGG